MSKPVVCYRWIIFLLLPFTTGISSFRILGDDCGLQLMCKISLDVYSSPLKDEYHAKPFGIFENQIVFNTDLEVVPSY